MLSMQSMDKSDRLLTLAGGYLDPHPDTQSYLHTVAACLELIHRHQVYNVMVHGAMADTVRVFQSLPRLVRTTALVVNKHSSWMT